MNTLDNDLNGSISQTRPAQPSRLKEGNKRNGMGVLDVGTRAKSKMYSSTSEQNHLEEPAKKRQRREVSAPTKPGVVPNNDGENDGNDADDLAPSSWRLAEEHRVSGLPSSSYSRPSAHIKGNGLTLGVPEYQDVERTMQLIARQPNKQTISPKYQPAAATVEDPMTIDISDEESFTKGARESRMRQDAERPINLDPDFDQRTRRDGSTSPYFQKGNSDLAGTRNSARSSISVNAKHATTTLRQAFVQVDGKRRNSEVYNDSSDELNGESTVGDKPKQMDMYSRNELRRNDPSSEAEVPRPTKTQVLPLGRSPNDIRRTDFASSARIKETSVREKRSRKTTRDHHPLLKFPLEYFRHGDIITSESLKCEIVIDKNERVFGLCCLNPSLENGDCLFTKSGNKVQKIQFGKDPSCRLQLVMVRSGNSDFTMDIEFCSRKDAVEFAIAFQDISAGCTVKDRERYVLLILLPHGTVDTTLLQSVHAKYV